MTPLAEAPSIGQRILELFESHLSLVQLEWRYESRVGRQRFIVATCAGLCLASAFVYLQIILTLTLMAWGMSLAAACSVLAIVLAGGGAGLYRWFGQRDPRVKEPFEGTRQELKRSLQWIQTHIS